MSKLDFDADISILWESIPFNPALMGEEIKSSNWFMLHAVWVKYTSDNDFLLKVNLFKKGALTTKEFIAKKNKPYMKFQVPIGQTCDEFTLSISSLIDGFISTAKFEIQSIGVLWKPIQVGSRG